MAGIEIRHGKLLNGDTNYREASYENRQSVTLPRFFKNSYFRIISGQVVKNDLPLEIGDSGTVLEPEQVMYEHPASGENDVVIEITVIK